jgi:DNA mismatch repair protein MutS2
MRVPLDDLQRLDKSALPIEHTVPDSLKNIAKPESPGLELDLRGQRVEVGLQALDKYLDAAVLASLPWVRIIHGKGTGQMRKAVRDHLRQYAAVQNFKDGEAKEGGEGVTIAYLTN